MTEDDAREKCCPIIRAKCFGSGCMMWRDQEEPEGWRMARMAQIPLKSVLKFGYCGLGGER